MINDDKMGSVLLLAFLLLTACVATRNDGGTGFSKGDQYLRYGTEAFAAGQPAVAESRFRWALGIFEKTGDLDGQIRAHINLAEQAFQARDIPAATAHINRAEALVMQSGETGYQRRILLIQSSITLNQKDYDQARTLLTSLVGGAGEQPNDKNKDSIYIAALINRAALSYEQDDGEFSQWVNQLKRSVDPGNGRLLRFEAELYRRNGDIEKADASFERAQLSYQSGSSDRAIAATLREWAQLDIGQGRWHEASHKLRRSILIMDEVGDQEGMIEGLQLLVKAESGCGRVDEADRLSKLVTVYQGNKAPHGVRVVLPVSLARPDQHRLCEPIASTRIEPGRD